MKEIQIRIPGQLDGMVIRMPENCYSPFIYPTPNCKVEKRRIGAEPYCKAVHKSHPECDCRWCVFHREFNKAKGKESEVLAQIINP